MNTLTSDCLADLTIVALERTAFLLADPAEVDDEALQATTRSASVRYGGPENGLVLLRTSDQFLLDLASSLLGVEPEEIDLATCGEDAIKELTNIVGGSVINELGGGECTYSIGLPQVVSGTDRLPSAGATSATCCVECDGNLLFVTWIPEAASASKAA